MPPGQPWKPELVKEYTEKIRRGLKAPSLPTTSSELGREMGTPASTTRKRIRALGLQSEVNEAYERNRAARATAPDVAGTEKLRDVTTKEGREHANRELQVRDLLKENKKLKAEVLDQENFVERIVIASTSPLPKPTYKVRRRSSGRSTEERAVLLPIFDCQYGTKVIPSDTVGGIGRFDSEVFAHRAARYVEVVSKIVRAQAQNFHIGPMVFAIGGDMVEGDEIFEDQAWQLEMPSPDQVLHMRDHLSWIIDALMSVGAEVGARKASVLCVPGNHGRRGKKQSGRHKRDSFDVMVYRLLQERLKDHPIFTFAVEPAGNCTFEVLGNLFAMIHGDEVKGWGGLPFYGMTRHDARMNRTLNVLPDYVLLGHHHQPASIPIGYGEWLMSGNWVGATNLSGIVGSNTPQQAVYMIDENNGLLDRIPVLLDEVRKPTPKIHRTM